MSVESDPESATILLDVALQFGTARSLGELLDVVMRRVVELFQAERALFALFDPAGRIEQAVVHNLPWEGPGHPLPISHTVIQQVMRNASPVAMPDTLAGNGPAPQSVRLYRLRFIAATPVVVRDQVAGVIYVDSTAPAVPVVERRVATFRALGSIVGRAVENARLFEAEELRNTVLAMMVHDLKSPLTALQLNGELLRDEEDPQLRREVAEDYFGALRRLGSLCDSTLRLCQAESVPHHWMTETVDALKIAREHMHWMQVVGRARDLQLHVDAGETAPRVATVEDLLRAVLDNLIFNALKYATKGTQITLTARERADAGPPEAAERPRGSLDVLFRNIVALVPDPAAGFVELSVINTCPPLDANTLRRLFLPFERGVWRSFDARSLGLGLAFCDHLVRRLGGCIWVDRSDETGTAFSFTLPRALL